MDQAEAVTRDVHRVVADHGVDHAAVELRRTYADRHIHLNDHAH